MPATPSRRAPSPNSPKVRRVSRPADTNGGDTIPLEPLTANNGQQQDPIPIGSPTATRPASIVRSYMPASEQWTLHAAPTSWMIGSCMVTVMLAMYLIRNHIVSTKDHVGLFAIGSYVIFSSYFLAHYWLDRLSSSFRKISSDKKFYTISNLLKSGILAALTPFAIYELYLIMVHDQWNTNTLRNMGCIYCIPDFVSMILVRKMSATTYAHHICVCVFNYFSIYNDYANDNVCRLIVVYAAFSTFAYCVNMLLGTRFLGVDQIMVKALSVTALVVYVSCCALNWTWQALALRRLIGSPNDHWTVYVYMMLIMFVMYDDIVLMKWLWYNVTTKVVTASGASVLATGTATNAAVQRGARKSSPGNKQQ